MRAVREPLAAAIAELERAFTEGVFGQEQEWAARLDHALARLEKGVRRHDEGLEALEGGVVDVASAQAPSATMDRKIAHLHHDLHAVLQQARALRDKVLAAQARPTEAHFPEFEAFRRRAGDLLDALARYEEKEMRLILESTTTDIGAGD